MSGSSIPGTLKRGLAAALACAALACGGGDGGDAPTPAPATPVPPAALQEVRVRLDQTFQHVTGFGGSSAWHRTPPSLTQADQLFSVERGIGLSLHRIRIAPDGTTWEVPTARLALARGARVWAAPWSPPGAWKTNGSDTDGGSLLPERYPSWADRLADFVLAVQAQGVPIAYLSAQNEPGWVAEWETCEWTPAQLLTFVRDHLGPALARRDLDVPLLVPESNDWLRLRDFADPLLDDPRAARFIDVIAVHAYGGAPFVYERPMSQGMEFWQTEWSTPSTDAGMTSGLELAQSIHDHLTTGRVNAYHYWWLTHDASDSAGGLIQNGVATKRLWTMGNYSKFVRPGSVRVGVDRPTSAYNLAVTAFRRDAAGRLVVVAINRGRSVQPLRVRLEGGRVGAVVPWITFESADLAPQSSVSGGASFEYDLPAQSVVTFVAPLD